MDAAPVVATRPRTASWTRAALEPRLLLLALLLALSLALRLAVAWRPAPELVLKTLPDDAFYYLKGAENIAGGLGASLDGRTPTNGFHPLWMAALVPVFSLFDRDAALHVALTLTSVVDTLTVALVFLAALQLTGRRTPALLAAAFYGLNPVIVLSAVNGMESAFVLFTWLLLVNLHFWLLGRGRRAGPGAFALFGAAAGLAFLARTDGVFLVAALFLAAAIAVRPLPWRGLGIAAAAGAVVVAPWFAWSIARFGTPLQVSGEAPTWAAHRQFDPAGQRPIRDSLGHGANLVRQALGSGLAEDYLYHRPWLAAGLGALAGVAAVAWLLGGRPRPARPWLRGPLLLLPPTAALLALVVAHQGIRWHVREWYFLPAVPLAALWLGQAAAAIDGAAVRRSAILAGSLAAAVAVAFLVPYLARGREDWRQGRYFWQADSLRAAQWMDTNLPPDAVVGSLNAGIFSWFDGRTTVNLDGVMNEDAYDALRDHDLVRYVDGAGVTDLADSNWMLFTLYGPYWASDLGDLTARLGPDPLASFYTDDRVSRFGTVVVFPYRPPNRE